MFDRRKTFANVHSIEATGRPTSILIIQITYIQAKTVLQLCTYKQVSGKGYSGTCVLRSPSFTTTCHFWSEFMEPM